MILGAIKWSRAFYFMYILCTRQTSVPDHIDNPIWFILHYIERLDDKRKDLLCGRMEVYEGDR